jgi:heavy metal efflux system protein
MRFNEMLEGTKAELSVKIFGDDYDVLENRAEQIKSILEETPGVAQVEFETEGQTPQLQLQINRDVLRRYNLQAAEGEPHQQGNGGWEKAQPPQVWVWNITAPFC